MALFPGTCFLSCFWSSFCSFTKSTLHTQTYLIFPRFQAIQKDRTHFWTSWPPWEGHMSRWLSSFIPRRPGRSRNLGRPKEMVKCRRLCIWRKSWFLRLEMSFLIFFSFLSFSACPSLRCGRFYLPSPLELIIRFMCYFFLINFFLAAMGLSCNMRALNCGMWELVPRPGGEPGPPALGARSPSH